MPRAVDAETRFCAVLGYPVRHSASPAMHNAAIEALGLNWCYGALEVRPEELRAAIEGARSMRFIGLNLTVPHKLIAVEMMDVLDESASAWGAVNTVRFETRNAARQWIPLGQCTGEINEVRAHGFNTDAEAIVRSISEDLGLSLRGKKVLLLGAGGAGRVAALKIASEDVARLWLVNRTRDKAEALAAEIQRRNKRMPVEVGYPREDIDLVVNATSLGLKPDDPSPLQDFPLRQAKAAYDMIYRPAETPLLRAAREAGCATANGLGMLLHQGARAFELWSGQKAPIDIMRDALARNVYGEDTA